MGGKTGKLRIGTSGYQYRHWRGVFYPADLPTHQWFAFYARHFNTVEINNTFYRVPAGRTFSAWRRAAPRGFEFTLKFSRYGSHLKRLQHARQTLRYFLTRATRLQDRLGPILVQLPPHWKVNAERLQEFLAALPADRRWSLEFRDPSWLCREIYDLLHAHSAALCIHDMLPDHPRRITADFVYLRFHGHHYGGSYTPAFLRAQARSIRAHLVRGRDVFVYFNNDGEGHAVHNARELKTYLHDE